MERLKNFIPMPTEFMEKAIACNLSKPELRVLHAISYEILRWHNCRRTMSKKISHSFIAEKLKMHPGNVTRTINKLEKKEFIIIVEKGTGSAPSIIKLNCSIVQSTVPADSVTDTVQGTAVEEVATVQGTLQNHVSPVQSTVQNPPDQINISIKKDQISENDSFNIDKEDKGKIIAIIEENGKKIIIREKKPSLNSIDKSQDKQSVINLLCPGGEANTDELSSIGSVIGSALAISIPDGPTPMIEERNISPLLQIASINVTDKTLSAGKEVLKSKNYSLQEIQSITQRIFESMKKQKKINNEDRYFLKAVYNEKAKGERAEGTKHCKAPASSDIHVNIPGEAHISHDTTAHNSTCTFLQVKAKVKPPVTEEKQAPPAAEVIEKIKTFAPTELYQVIMSVDSDPKVIRSMQFFSSDIVKKEVLASHYVTEFKKRYPDIKIYS